MTIGNLKQIIDELLADGKVTEETEVRLATQPRYPLEYEVQGLVTLNEARTVEHNEDEDNEEDDVGPEVEKPEDNIVYLCEGTQVGYLEFGAAAWSEAREY